MRKIIVMHTKGGCGKTTVAINLASLYASRGVRTALFDYDPQGSSLRWLQSRPKNARGIFGVNAAPGQGHATRAWLLRVPAETQRVVIDTPAAISLRDYQAVVDGVDVILLPVLPSSIDMHATAAFIRELLLTARVRTERTRIGIITNRIKTNTIALQRLEKFLASLRIPVVGELRDTQKYVWAAENGIGIHEMKGDQAQRDLAAWEAILAWIEPAPPAADSVSVTAAASTEAPAE